MADTPPKTVARPRKWQHLSEDEYIQKRYGGLGKVEKQCAKIWIKAEQRAGSDDDLTTLRRKWLDGEVSPEAKARAYKAHGTGVKKGHAPLAKKHLLPGTDPPEHRHFGPGHPQYKPDM